MTNLPKFFRVRQTFARPRIEDLTTDVVDQLSSSGVQTRVAAGQSVAITVGSRGVANIAKIAKACVGFFQQIGAKPFIVPAMGSHGGATPLGQLQVLESYGVTEAFLNCPVRSSMDIVEVCRAAEGFPVYFDRLASEADHVFVMNRIKPHTRFAGDIESGLMKMMLIGLGKQKGAEVYHRVIMNYSFDQIVRSVSRRVIEHCKVVGGLAILENAYEETAQVVGLRPAEIEAREPELLNQVKRWMPGLPFERSEMLIVDRIGKDISGTGMDTNVVGRKRNDHGSPDELPYIHHIYIRDLTEATHGNATGLGMAEMCHRRVIETMDMQLMRMNCVTAGHITAAMVPLDFANDAEALRIGCQLAGYIKPEDVPALWIADTLHLEDIECSQIYWDQARQRSDLDILTEPTELNFDAQGDLLDRFKAAHKSD